MPSMSAMDTSAFVPTDVETQTDEASLPFDLTIFVSQHLSVSVDEASELMTAWMREQNHSGNLPPRL